MKSSGADGMRIDRKGPRQSSVAWRWMALITVAASIFLNYWNSVRPLAGKTNSEISDQYPTLFTPAAFTFSIWGLIFLSLVIYAVIQLLPAWRDEAIYDRLAKPVVLSNCLSILWAVLFSMELVGWSALVIAIMLITSLILLSWAHEGVKNEGVTHWLTIPFSLYSGWLTVATIAGVAVWLTSLGWNGGGHYATVLTVLLILITGFTGVYVSYRLKDFVFPLAIVWGLAGIYAAQKSASPVVATTAVVVGVIVVLVTVSLLKVKTLS